MTTVRRWTGTESRALRQAMRLSVRDLAAKLGVSVRTVTKWESLGAKIKLRLSSEALLDTLLRQANGEVQARFDAFLAVGESGGPRSDVDSTSLRVRAPLCDDARRSTVQVETVSYPAGFYPPTPGRLLDSEAEDVQRRRLLQGVASLGLAGSASAIDIEALRHDLVAATFGDGPAVLDDWDAIAWEYGYSYSTTVPNVLLNDLTRDLALARQQLDRLTAVAERSAMQRVIARLSVFLAQTLANLGDLRASYRWWLIARRTADACGDLDVRVWARGREVIRGLYEQRALPAVLDLADEAISLSPTAGMGTASVLAGRAQALAVQDRTAEALAGIEATERIFEAQPASVTRDTSSMYGWPEYRLRHSQSFVYTHLGDTTRAAHAQEQALELYPTHMFRERTLVQLHQALRLVRSGDVAVGASHAQQVITSLPETQRIHMVMQVAQSVVQAVPRTTQPHTEVVGLRELLAVPVPSQQLTTK